MARIKPLEWDRRSEGLSVCHFLGMTYTLASHFGPYCLTCRGVELYCGGSEQDAIQVAQDHAQSEVCGVLLREGEE